MTETEAQTFVSEILKGYWPDWGPADSMYGLWARKLIKFDFNKAKHAIGEWLCETKYTKKQPPINNIIQYLLLKKAYDNVKFDVRPVNSFEIFCEDWQANQIPDGPPVKRRYSFWAQSLAALTRRDPQEIEREAEVKRQRYINWYGGNWAVSRDWMQYFEEERNY